MNPRFLAAGLWVIAAGIFYVAACGVIEARRRHDLRAAASAILAAAVLAAVLANAGVDLW